MEGLRKKVGYVMLTSFGDDQWVGSVPFRIIFHMIYPISNKQKAKVDEVGFGEDKTMVYDF